MYYEKVIFIYPISNCSQYLSIIDRLTLFYFYILTIQMDEPYTKSDGNSNDEVTDGPLGSDFCWILSDSDRFHIESIDFIHLGRWNDVLQIQSLNNEKMVLRFSPPCVVGRFYLQRTVVADKIHTIFPSLLAN
jgi:hypothetical protein